MRNIFHFQAEIGSLPIEDIRIDPKSRDDIPALLSGLQYLYTNEKTRAELFNLLEKEALPDVNLAVGRPGMTLWGILVMGVLKQGLGCDFDRLHELVNQHKTIQAFLGHGSFAPEYRRQQVIDNVHLLSPAVLSKVGQWVVNAGHRVSKKKPGVPLRRRCKCARDQDQGLYSAQSGLAWNTARNRLPRIIRQAA